MKGMYILLVWIVGHDGLWRNILQANGELNDQFNNRV